MEKQKQEAQGASVDLGVLDDGTVAMQFGKLIKQITFAPDQAKRLGLGLIEMATRAESIQRGKVMATGGRSDRKN